MSEALVAFQPPGIDFLLLHGIWAASVRLSQDAVCRLAGPDLRPLVSEASDPESGYPRTSCT
jgi:hypothetical protein